MEFFSFAPAAAGTRGCSASLLHLSAEGGKDMEKNAKPGSGEGLWLKVFCPDARCLSAEEIVNLPAEVRETAGSTGREGLWLEVFCPDQSCLAEEERVALPVRTVSGGQEKGFWLKLFCPEEQCVLEEPTDVA
jgi:hypothetical protein